MKLRIKGNSVRIRLTQTEVDKFSGEGLVRDQVQFGNNTLNYLLEAVESEHVQANYEFNTIRIGVPESIKNYWINNDEVGFDATISQEGGKLYILVEKDFQCLIPREEDESDLFENPMSN